MRLIILCLFILANDSLQAQRKNKTQAAAVPDAVAKTIPAPGFDAKLYGGLKWRNIGPFRGGRSNAVSGVIGNDQIYYTGYTGGGIWKTEDAGLNWKNISDGHFSVGSIGEITVSESDANIIYAGSGEHAVRGVMTSYGNGIYKTVDAGKTWKNIGLEKTRHISDIVVHPANPDIVLVAAQGALHGPSEDRGIYKSTDGGTTWKKVLYVDENSGASSLSMDMNNPRILYAATWQHRRYPWAVESGGPGSALWKSVDGGETWNKIVKGLPKELGKMGISVSRANSNRVYAIVETEKAKSGLYRSDDGGGSWTLLSNNQDISSRSWYYMEVFADPINEDIVYVLNAPMMRSIDGGKTFSNIRVGHGDTHDLWINPSNNANMILGDDGGGEISFNSGGSWSTEYNQPTAQFYRVNADKTFPYKVYGGQQDNSSVVIASRTNGPGITESDWHAGPGCESAFIAFDPHNPVVLFGGCYQGYIEALDTRTMETKDIMEYPTLNLAVKPKDMKYRFNWNAPIVASPHDPNTIYHAGNVLFKTTNGGLSWDIISPDLTRNDTTKQGPGGRPFTNEGAGGENYNTIYYVIESEKEKGVLWTGSDCGLVHLTRDGGTKWQNVTPAGLEECLIQSIEISPHDNGTAYISASRYKFNDFNSYTYKTTDYGTTWTKITNGIDTDDFLKVIREDPKVKGLLYAGAERGFYISFNGGTHWHKFQLNLPVVPVTDLIIRDNDLVAATAGRAFWILDDLGAIQQSAGKLDDTNLKLFMPKPTYRFGGGGGRTGGPVGQNPMGGVVFDFYLKEKIDSGELKLQILDPTGALVRSYSNKKDENHKTYPGGPPANPLLPAEKGVNRFAWDFRTLTIPGVTNVYIYGDPRGHRVAPGKYKARLSLGSNISETEFEIVPDPRIKATAAQWNDQQQFLQRIEDRIKEIHLEVNNLRKLKDQVNHYNEVLKDRSDLKDLVEAGKELVKKMDTWESNVVETRIRNGQDVINWPSKLNAEFFAVKTRVDEADPRVTEGARQRIRDLEDQWTKHKLSLQNLVKDQVGAYNRLFREKNVPALIGGL